VAFSDVDLSDGHTASFAAAVGNATHLGTFALGAVSEGANAATGSVGWTYALDNATAQYLAAGQTVTETYTVTVDDGHGGTAAQDVTVTITGTNDAPTITAQDLVGGVTEQVTPAGNLSDHGVISFADVDLTDVHSVSVTPVGSPLGTLTAVKDTDTTGTGAGGQLTWTYTVADSAVEYLAKDQTKVESFTVKLDDGNGGVITRDVVVTITGTNDAPTITSPAQAGAVVEDAPSTPSPTDSLSAAGTVAFSDVDLSDNHTATAVAAATNATHLGTFALGAVSEAANAADGSVGWTYTLDNTAAQYLAQGQTVTETYVVTINDGLATTTQNVDVTITGTNDAPVISLVGTDSATAGLAETNAGLATAGHVTVTDVDLTDVDTLSVDSVSIGAASTGSTSVSAAALKAMMSVDQNGAWHFNSGSEAFDSLAAGQTLVLNYVLKADDGLANATQTVAVTITGANDAPVGAVLANQNSDEDTAFSFTAPASTDVDSASLTYSATLGNGTALPSWLHFDAATRTFSGTPPQDFNGVVAVKMITSDGSLTDSSTFNLTINPVNDAPVAGADTLSATEDTPVTYTANQLLANDTDVDSPTLHISSVTSGTGGTATLNGDGTVTFTPSANFNGPASFTYKASDGALDSAAATVTVNVAAVNDPPVFTSGATGSVAENAPVSTVVYDASVTDVDGAPAVFSITGADAGLFNINATTGEVTFKASPNFEAPTDAGANNVYDFSVNAFDGTATTSQAVVVTVTNVNEAPVIDSDGAGATATKSVPENTTAVTTVHATDPDAGTTLAYSIVGGADAAKFSINAATGALAFVAAPDFEAPTDADHNNSYIVQVRASDGALNDDQTLTVNVTDVVETPPDTQGPTSVGFTLAPAGATTETGGVLTAADAIGTFVAKGDPNSVTFHYALSGADALKFSLNTTTGALSVGGSDLAAQATPYAITISALDQANNAVSQDVKVWIGGSGDQSLLGVGTNVDFQYGLNGNDTLTGGAGDDALVGGQNVDLLIGGAGSDQLYGGANSDAFRFTAVGDAGDKILDFQTTGGNADTVQLSVPGFSLQNPAAVAFVDDTAATIAGANIIRWTGSVASMDTPGEVNAFLATKAGTFAGGAFVLAYDTNGHVALYYDDHANDGTATSTVTMITSFDNMTSTSTFVSNDFLFV
jgi:VCBS repeat-containing protein